MVWHCCSRETSPRKERQVEGPKRVNLGHPPQAAIIRAMRQGARSANNTTLQVCRRVQTPKDPKPSWLPRVAEFNVLPAMDCFERKDSDGDNYEFLGVFCCGTHTLMRSVFRKTHPRTRRQLRCAGKVGPDRPKKL